MTPEQKLMPLVSVTPKDGNKVPVRLPTTIDAHSGKTIMPGAYVNPNDPLVTLTEPGTAGMAKEKKNA